MRLKKKSHFNVFQLRNLVKRGPWCVAGPCCAAAAGVQNLICSADARCRGLSCPGHSRSAGSGPGGPCCPFSLTCILIGSAAPKQQLLLPVWPRLRRSACSLALMEARITPLVVTILELSAASTWTLRHCGILRIPSTTWEYQISLSLSTQPCGFLRWLQGDPKI